MSSPINYFSSRYSVFLADKTSFQNKDRTNQVQEVRLIPGLKLFPFLEYGPLFLVQKDCYSCVCYGVFSVLAFLKAISRKWNISY